MYYVLNYIVNNNCHSVITINNNKSYTDIFTYKTK